jgi:hypothetical protein
MAEDLDIRYRLVAPLAEQAGAWIDVGGDPEAAAAVERTTVDPGDVPALRAAVAQAEDALVTALDVLERLPDYVALVDTLVELGEEHGATVVLAVPDHGNVDEAPTTPPVFTPGAVDELRRLLPAGHVVLRQVPIRGAAIVAADAGTERHALDVAVTPAAPTHHVLAFGPRASSLTGVAAAEQADATSELARLRGLEADAALAAALVDERRARA